MYEKIKLTKEQQVDRPISNILVKIVKLQGDYLQLL